MDDGRELARRALIRRINDFKPDENIDQVIHELVEEMWAIFQDDVMFGKRPGKPVVFIYPPKFMGKE